MTATWGQVSASELRGSRQGDPVDAGPVGEPRMTGREDPAPLDPSEGGAARPPLLRPAWG